MKKIAILIAVLFVFTACADNKKADEKQVEATIQKIDSISEEVQKSTEDLEKTVNEVKEAVEELENI